MGTVQPFAYDDSYNPDEPIQQTPPDDTDAPKRTRTRRPKLGKIRDEIKPDVEQIVGLVSLILSPVSPTAAEYNEQHVDKTVDDVARLCVRHPRLLEIIKQTGDLGAYIGLLELLAGLALAFLIDRERIEPEMFVARALRVTDAYYASHPEAKGGDTNGSNPAGAGIESVPSLLA